MKKSIYCMIFLLSIPGTVFGCLRTSQSHVSEIHMDLIIQALSVYVLDCGSLPDEASGLKSLNTNGGCLDSVKSYFRSDKIIIDSWGNQFIYKNPGVNNPSSYDLFSIGEDEASGTKDDINNWDKQFIWRESYKDPWYRSFLLSIFCD